MKANELRIGNYHYYQSFGNIIRLDADILISLLSDGLLDIHKIQPIPLTEEWLIKFGFEKINHIHGYFFYTLSKSKINKCHIDIYEHKTLWMNYAVTHCKYVHQLQNLYFALTNEELTITQ